MSKNLTILTILIIILSCNTQKSKMSNSYIDKASIVDWCPENGNCTFKLINNATLALKSSHGNFYIDRLGGDNSILTFTYDRIYEEDLQDASYKEVIQIEIPNLDEASQKLNLSLMNYKVYYTRLCFCRGATGAVRVREGDLTLKKIQNNLYEVNLIFKNNKYPQILESVNQTFSLN